MKQHKKDKGKSTNQKKYLNVCSLSALIIGIVIRLVKAYNLPIVYDEAYTFLHYADKPISVIFSSYIYPNNHLLNTLLMHFMLNLGNSEFLLRIPSLVGSIIFLVAIYMMLNLLTDQRIKTIAMVLIAIQPFLVDFGSLARGYSLGLAFSFLGLYIILDLFSHRQNPTSQWKRLLIASLCFILAMAAVPIFVNIIAPIFITLCAFDCVSRNPKGKYGFSIYKFSVYNIFLFLPTIVGTFLVYINIFKSLTHEQFVFGYSTVMESLRSFITNDLLYGTTSNNAIVVSVLVLCIVSLTHLIYKGFKNRDRILSMISIVPIISIGFSLLEHYMFSMPYPLDRVVIYLIPFLLISFVYLTVELIDLGSNYTKWLNHEYTFILITALLILSVASLNEMTYFLTWKNNAAVKPIMKTLINERSSFPEGNIVICVPWQLDVCFYYYEIIYKAYFIKYNCNSSAYNVLVETPEHNTYNASDPIIIYNNDVLRVIARRVR